MARVPELDSLAAFELSDGRRLDEAVHFVHVYTIEAHPALPEPTPYKQWTADDLPDGGGTGTAYADVEQPYTWSGRAALGNRILLDMESDPIMLVDDVDVPANPVWCTYGTAPNAAFVIDQDGTITRSQLWANVSKLRSELLELVDAPDEQS